MKFEKLLQYASLAGAVALIAITAAVAPSALAQGKGGGGGGGGGAGDTGGGTIYFINGATQTMGTNWMWSMNSDGSSVTQLKQWGYFNTPSRTLHNGYRWYLTTLSIPGEYYPDGTTLRSEVFAIRGDYDNVLNNNSETRVQLTNDPTLQPTFGWFQGMHWQPGDAGISFKARRWDGLGPVEGGLYTAELVYRADGNVIGLATQPTAPTLSFPLDANGWPTLNRHSWGFSNTQVAYIDSHETGLWTANLSTGARTQIYSGGVGFLDWSQDGTKIVFGSGTIRTIKSDGTGLKTVIRPSYVNGAYSYAFGHAYFSPTGSHIVCVADFHPSSGPQNDVIRATSTGSSLTNLTNTPTMSEIPVSWR